MYLKFHLLPGCFTSRCTKGKRWQENYSKTVFSALEILGITAQYMWQWSIYWKWYRKKRKRKANSQDKQLEKRMSFIITGMKWDRSKTQLYFFLAMVSSNHPDILSLQDWFWFLEHLEVSSNEQSAFSMHKEYQEYQKTIIMPFIFPLIMPSVPRLGIWEMKHLQKLRWKIQENGRRMITKVICFACSGSLKP